MRAFHPADLCLTSELRVRVPVSKPSRHVGFIDRRATGIAIDICGAEVNEPLHGRVDCCFEDVTRADDVDPLNLAGRGPVRYQRAAVNDVSAPLHRASDGRRAHEISDHDLDAQ